MSQTEQPCDPETHEELRGTLEAVEEAHQFWHDCQVAYQDPAAFRRSLNALIQAERNITWRLQSAKDAIPGFPEWYDSWQTFMRANSHLRWLRDARTRVVKQSGLSSRSRARVTLIYSYEEPARVAYDMPPELSADELLQRIVALVPTTIAPTSVVEIERRWEVDELPGEELLLVLADTLRMIMSILDQGHARMHGEEDLATPEEASAGAEEPPCMAWPREARVLRINPSTGVAYEPSFELVPRLTEDEGKKRARRYGWSLADLGFMQTDDPIIFGEGVVKLATKMLRRDGYHQPILFLHAPQGGWQPMSYQPMDWADKHLFWHLVARRVDAEGYDAFVFVAESWFTLSKDSADQPSPSDDPNRQEALTVSAESADGTRRSWFVPFKKRRGRIRLAPVQRVEEEALYAEPVRRVWAKRGGSDH